MVSRKFPPIARPGSPFQKRRAFVPTLRGSTTNPTFGATANRNGWYVVVDGWCHGGAVIADSGAGFSAGSGNCFVTVPVPFDDGIDPLFPIVTARSNLDGTFRIGVGDRSNTVFDEVNVIWQGQTGQWTWAGVPVAFGAGDELVYTFSYPVKGGAR